MSEVLYSTTFSRIYKDLKPYIATVGIPCEVNLCSLPLLVIYQNASSFLNPIPCIKIHFKLNM